MATVSAAFPCKSANPSAPQRGTTPTKITLAPLIHPAFPFENDQASQRLALNPHKPRHHRRTQTTPRFPPSRLFGRLPPCIRSRLRTAGVRKPLTKAAVAKTAYAQRVDEALIAWILTAIKAKPSKPNILAALERPSTSKAPRKMRTSHLHLLAATPRGYRRQQRHWL